MMLRALANFVDRMPVRLVLVLGALAMTGLFAGFCALRAFEDHAWRLVELGGVLGLIGWWTRVVVRHRSLCESLPLRIFVLALLAIGIATAVYMFALLPSSYFAVPVLAIGLGALLLLGSLAPSPADA